MNERCAPFGTRNEYCDDVLESAPLLLLLLPSLFLAILLIYI